MLSRADTLSPGYYISAIEVLTNEVFYPCKAAPSAYKYKYPVVDFMYNWHPAQSETLNITGHTSFGSELLKTILLDLITEVYLKIR